MRGNDLELGIEYQIPVNVLEESTNKSVLIKSNTFSDIISKMKSDQIVFNLNDQLYRIYRHQKLTLIFSDQTQQSILSF